MQPVLDKALGADPPPVPVRLNVAEGQPAAVLVERAAEPDIAIVVVGTRGHGVIAGIMLGSTSHALAHSCPKPLVIVPHGWGGTS